MEYNILNVKLKYNNGLKWLGHYWVFTSLQIGLASSAQIYTDFADAIE